MSEAPNWCFVFFFCFAVVFLWCLLVLGLWFAILFVAAVEII